MAKIWALYRHIRSHLGGVKSQKGTGEAGWRGGLQCGIVRGGECCEGVVG